MKVNYVQKKALMGRIVYIGLTLMAVTVLCVTMYTFFGGAKESNKNKLPISTNGVGRPPVTDGTTEGPKDPPPVTEPPASSDTPTLKPEKDWLSASITMPVDGTVTKKHDLLNAVYSSTMNDYRVHRGIDIECSIGDDACAVADGVISEVGADPFMGMTVTVDHGDGLISVYKNLSPELPAGIKAGESILEGDVIGQVGESAIIEIADEGHLHFELTLKGEPLDPLKLLDYKSVSAPDGEEK